MRIDCPYCGSRDLREFAFHGDEAAVRSAFSSAPPEPGAIQPEIDRVYLRDNPAGLHRGLWYHEAGCHSWLVIERDTLTHAIHSVTLAVPPAAREPAR